MHFMGLWSLNHDLITSLRHSNALIFSIILPQCKCAPILMEMQQTSWAVNKIRRGLFKIHICFSYGEVAMPPIFKNLRSSA